MAGPPERLPTTKRLEPSCERALKTEPILDRYKRNPQLHEYLAAFNSAEAFQALGHEFIDRRITPEIRAAGKVNILYPGGGHHLAPLETAFVILNQVKEVQEVALTYTEIDWKNAEKLSASLLILHELGLFNSFDRKTLPKRKRGQKGKEELFTLGFVDQCGTKKTVTIRFAYCMSGEKWYRDDYFKESDIFVCHDPGEGDHGVGNMFDRFIYDGVRHKGKKQRTLFTEPSTFLDENTPQYWGGKTTTVHSEYGCRKHALGEGEEGKDPDRYKDHLGAPHNKAVVFFSPDKEFFKHFSSKELNALKEIIDLISGTYVQSREASKSTLCSKSMAIVIKMWAKIKRKSSKIRKVLEKIIFDMLGKCITPYCMAYFLKWMKKEKAGKYLETVAEMILEQNKWRKFNPMKNFDIMIEIIQGKRKPKVKQSQDDSERFMNNLLFCYEIATSTKNKTLLAKV